ncbi:MAG: hypothetical protein ACRC1P_08585 [Cellulosilyticaceae bacterium]
MELIQIYEAYNELNKDYIQILEEITSQPEHEKQEAVLVKLKAIKAQLEELMNQSSELVLDQENEQNLKDLRYLITDNFFLAVDLVHFYEHNEIGRFKMRVVNYLNKKRRHEFFQ